MILHVRHEDPGAKLIDSFSLCSLDKWCCVCGAYNMEDRFCFAKNDLEDTVVSSARSEGARRIFLVPTNHKAPYFMCLKQLFVGRSVARLTVPLM